MNLELLDPFGRQIPDRVDATLPLAPHLHFRQPNHEMVAAATSSPTNVTKKGNHKENKDETQQRPSNTTNVNVLASNMMGSGLSETGGTISGVTAKRDVPEWRAAYHVSYNRRGTYVAVGYGSGAVAVHSTSSRTLSALYRSNRGFTGSNADSSSPTNINGGLAAGSEAAAGGNGVTTVSWSRRSRTLLAGAAGDGAVVVYDTTHPFGPEEAGLAIEDWGFDLDTENGEKRPKNAPPLVVHENNLDYIPPAHSRKITALTSFADPIYDERTFVFVKYRLHLESINVPMGSKVPQHVIDSFVIPTVDIPDDEYYKDDESMTSGGEDASKKGKKRKKKKKKKRRLSSTFGYSDHRLNKHPCVSFPFHGGKFVGGSLQINPRCATGGLAALVDGSLVLFWFDPATSWITQIPPDPHDSKDSSNMDDVREEENEEDKTDKDSLKEPKKKMKQALAKKYAIVVPLWSQTSKHFITCAAFDPRGERVYAATKDGTLLGFEVKLLFEALEAHSPNYIATDSQASQAATQTAGNVVASTIKGGLPLVAPHFKLAIPGGASAWHLIVSRNGKFLILNSSDGALRLYSTETCWTHNERKGTKPTFNKTALPGVVKPLWTFQDVVSKVKFVSCDLSGDGEYVVGGANGNDNRYELSIWNTGTGNLMDKLTGPAVQLYSVAWHPTRASLAVATSDGLVDIWGPKLNWTAFAPDFQALHKNVVYEEEDTDEEEDTNETNEADCSGKNDIEAQKTRTANDSGKDENSNGDILGHHLKNLEVDDPMKNMAMRDDIKVESTNDNALDNKLTTEAGANKNKRSLKESRRANSTNGSTPTDPSMMQNADKKVDVLGIEPVPMFASDSEEESETFAFETRIKNLFSSSRANLKNPRGIREED